MNVDLLLSGQYYPKCTCSQLLSISKDMQNARNVIAAYTHDSSFCLNAAAGLSFIGIVLRAHDSHLDLPEKYEVRVSKEATYHGGSDIERQEIHKAAETQPDTWHQYHPA